MNTNQKRDYDFHLSRLNLRGLIQPTGGGARAPSVGGGNCTGTEEAVPRFATNHDKSRDGHDDSRENYKMTMFDRVELCQGGVRLFQYFW